MQGQVIGTLPPVPWQKLKAERAGPEEILSAFGIIEPPVPIFMIARALGVRVSFEGTPNFAGSIDSTQTPAQITVNRDDPEVRQRFTVAHELGHLFLHPSGMKYRDALIDMTAKDRFIEVQANRFAANILLPEWMLRVGARRTNFNADALAKLFCVSAKAMAIRVSQVLG